MEGSSFFGGGLEKRELINGRSLATFIHASSSSVLVRRFFLAWIRLHCNAMSEEIDSTQSVAVCPREEKKRKTLSFPLLCAVNLASALMHSSSFIHLVNLTQA